MECNKKINGCKTNRYIAKIKILISKLVIWYKMLQYFGQLTFAQRLYVIDTIKNIKKHQL